MRTLYRAAAVLSLTLLFTGCGGADADDMNARQKEEAAAMQRAVQLASDTNAARVKIERAKAAALSSP